MLVAAVIAVRAEGRDLVVVLEEGERDIPSSAGLFIHGEIMEGAKEKPREEAGLIREFFAPQAYHRLALKKKPRRSRYRSRARQ